MKTLFNFIKSIKDTVKNLDNGISKIMKNGLKFSFILIVFATYILLAYHLSNIPDLFYIGLSLFKASSVYVVTFFIFSISFNSIKKELE